MTDQMMTRIEKLQAAHNMSDEDTTLLLTINYVAATRQHDLKSEELNDNMQAFTKRMCSMTSNEIYKTLAAVDPIGKDRLTSNEQWS